MVIYKSNQKIILASHQTPYTWQHGKHRVVRLPLVFNKETMTELAVSMRPSEGVRAHGSINQTSEKKR